MQTKPNPSKARNTVILLIILGVVGYWLIHVIDPIGNRSSAERYERWERAHATRFYDSDRMQMANRDRDALDRNASKDFTTWVAVAGVGALVLLGLVAWKRS